MQEQNNTLTPEEVARILQITRNTVYELVKRGELPAFRIGRKLRFDPQDVDLYKQQGKKIENANITFPVRQIVQNFEPAAISSLVGQELVICGQDIILDILARHLERYCSGLKVWRNHVGSFDGLAALYQNKANLAGVHLWDGDTGVYNIAYVRRLLPSIPALIVNLAGRMQGFYVKEGNPKNIKDWADLIRPDVRFINREKGCGTRVLLDEKYRHLGLDRLAIQGYEWEEFSHLAVASAVARGQADVALGNQKASLQVRGIEFIPLQAERYDLVMKQEDRDKVWYKTILQILSSQTFLDELAGLGDYDLSETGQINYV